MQRACRAAYNSCREGFVLHHLSGWLSRWAASLALLIAAPHVWGQPSTTQAAAATSPAQMSALLTIESYRQAIDEASLPDARKQAARALLETHRAAIDSIKARGPQDAAYQAGTALNQVMHGLATLFEDDEDAYGEMVQAMDVIGEQSAVLSRDPDKLEKQVERLALTESQRKEISALFDRTRDELRVVTARYKDVRKYGPQDDGLAPFKVQQVGVTARARLMQILSPDQRAALARAVTEPGDEGR